MVDNMFPLWHNDGRFSIKSPDKQQVAGIERLKRDIKDKKLLLRECHCLCQNEHPESDICISEKDRYGLPIPQLLCSKCGLIRSGLVFDDDSNAEFYKNYYRGIYNAGISKDVFWKDQCDRGGKLLSLFKQYVDLNTIVSVAEVGCGAGGILWAFHTAGKRVEGFDFDTDYLSYGTNKGLSLHFGEFDEEAKGTYDLVILSHVMEHFLNPIESMLKIIEKVNVNKYLMIEVPGILNIADVYYNPILYFQNAHIYNFYCDYLKVFFEKLGLKVIYGDEHCDFILQKPKDWKANSPTAIFDSTLANYPKEIEKYILDTQHEWTHPLFSRRIMHYKLWLFANKCGWQKIRPLFVKK